MESNVRWNQQAPGYNGFESEHLKPEDATATAQPEPASFFHRRLWLAASAKVRVRSRSVPLQKAILDSSGASAVEFALLMPIFLLFALGTVAYGIYFGAAHSVQQLAADAARAAVAGLSDSERASLAEQFISANGSSYLLIDTSRISVVAAPSQGDPNQFLVQLSYDASHLPIWNLYPPIPLPERTIAFGSTIRNGGV